MTTFTATIAQTLQQGIHDLDASDSAKLDCEILLLKVLSDSHQRNYDKTWLMTWPEKVLTHEQFQQFFHYISLRAQGMPVAYIIGEQGFWSFMLKVSPATLIPRPETELLVEYALDKIATDKQQRIVDLGTGSGAIALAIASERPDSHISATDNSLECLKIAQDNAQNLQLNNITFYQSHWFNDMPAQQFDIIVSNPPYIAIDDPLLSEQVKQYEPLTALYAGTQGLDDYQQIIHNCHPYLKSAGWLLFEHGFNQAADLQQLLSQSGFSNIHTYDDLNQLPRVTLAQLNP